MSGEKPMGYITKDQLGTPRLLEEDFELLTGGTIRIRGLSRNETVSLSTADAGDEYEAQLIHKGLVQPEGLTVTDIKKWRKATPSMEIKQVIEKIWDLSGLGEDATKATHKSVPDGQ